MQVFSPLFMLNKVNVTAWQSASYVVLTAWHLQAGRYLQAGRTLRGGCSPPRYLLCGRSWLPVLAHYNVQDEPN